MNLIALLPRGTARTRALDWSRRIAILAASGAGGALMLNVELPSARFAWGYVQGFIVAAVLLAMACRFIASRKEAVAVLLAWYAGSLASIPLIWARFFGDAWGWVAWAGLALVLSLPAVLAPRKRPALGVVVAVAIVAVPPLGLVGLGSPILAAGALFPGWGWIAIALTLAFYGLSAWRAKATVLAQIVMMAWAMIHLPLPAPKPPADAWAATTYMSGQPPKDLDAAYNRQDRAKTLATAALKQGAKVVVLPEGTDRMWSAGQAFYWRDVTELARREHAQVLVGAYTDRWHHERSNGLVDLASDRLYPARMSIPIAMWAPWRARGSFPLRMNANQPIPTAHGQAAYLICYEELMLWPLAMQEATGHPALLISAANQWFDTGWMLRPQTRSVRIQARLWGLPLIRAVNHAPL